MVDYLSHNNCYGHVHRRFNDFAVSMLRAHDLIWYNVILHSLFVPEAPEVWFTYGERTRGRRGLTVRTRPVHDWTITRLEIQTERDGHGTAKEMKPIDLPRYRK